MRNAPASQSTVAHELAVLSVKAAFTQALRESTDLELVEFSTWPLLFQFVSRPGHHESDTIVKPDAYIKMFERGNDRQMHNYFVEVNRSSETQDTLARKACCYRNYYRNGAFAARNGHSKPEDCPFIVLVICRNHERRNNAAERLLQLSPPVLQQVWLTTFEEVTENPLSRIWVRPIDYHKVTEGTEFDAERRRGIQIYRREPEREEIVEKSMQKQALLKSEAKLNALSTA